MFLVKALVDLAVVNSGVVNAGEWVDILLNVDGARGGVVRVVVESSVDGGGGRINFVIGVDILN